MAGHCPNSEIYSSFHAFSLFSYAFLSCKSRVLNACYSASQADVISQHIDYVIGMNQPLGDQAAIEFTIGFYDALCAGRSYFEAYKFGRNAIQLSGISERLTPVLHTKAG